MVTDVLAAGLSSLTIRYNILTCTASCFSAPGLLFTSKDKLGDWFEAYASLMELNVRTSTDIRSVECSNIDKKWTLVVSHCAHGQRTLISTHFLFGTGHAGEPNVPSFPDQGKFKGTIYHGSAHQDVTLNTPSRSLAVKRVLVVGTGNSGHDIAQNHHEASAPAATCCSGAGRT